MGIKSDGNNLLMFLIVGANGWIGSEIRRQLLETKTDFATANRIDIDSKSFWESISAKVIDQVPTILNLASPGLTSESQKSYERTTETIAHWVKKLNARSVHIGSAAEFGDVDHLINEETPIQPVTSYGVLKARTSEIALKSGACVLRPFNVVGRDQPIATPVGEWTHAIKLSPQEGGVLKLLNGSLERDFVSLPYVARVITHICIMDAQIDSLNICTGNGIVFKELVHELILESKKTILIDDACAGGIPRVIGNPEKLRTFGFSETLAVGQIAQMIYKD